MTSLRPGSVFPLLVISLFFVGCLHRGITPIRTHFNKGVYHYSEGALDAAISEYRMALEEDTRDHRARFNLAEALETRAVELEAEGAAEQAKTLRQAAEDHYARLLKDVPGHLRASVNLAAREHHKGDPSAAEDRLRSTIERHPRSALPRVALAAHRLGNNLPDARREAIQLLEEALRQDPANADANVLLGHALTLQATDDAETTESDDELIDRARQAFRRALDLSADDLGALMALARLELQADQPDAALPWLRRALYVNPDLLEAHLELSEILAARDELEQATLHLWQGRRLEDTRRPRLAPAEYRQRLQDLYRRLIEREQPASPTP